MSKNPLASIIIVNYNGRDFIGECINSVLKSDYPHFEIVVVDNGSTDGSVELIKELKSSRVRLIESPKNLYFTGGCNLGAQKAKGEKLIFLNSDTIVTKNWLKELVNFSKGHPKYLAQPKILMAEEKTPASLTLRARSKHRPSREVLDCARTIISRTLSSSGKIIDNVGGRYIFPGFGVGIGRNEIDRGQYDRNYQIDYVNGTCFLIDRQFFWDLGGFDKRFRYFYEDVDLCLRAKKAGGKCWYCFKSVIYHKSGLTFKQSLTKKEILFYIIRNRLLTLWKNQKNLIFQNPIIKSGSIVFIGTNAVNALNFVFTITMARLLGPQSFGEMAAIFSLLILIGIPSGVVVSTMAKYISAYQAQKKFWLLKKLVAFFSRLSLLSGMLLVFIFWGFTPFLSKFFQISSLPFIIFGSVFPIALLTDVNIGILQGLRYFLPFSLTPIIASTIKFILAVLLVSLGFSVSGVILAFVVAMFIAYLYASFQVHSYLSTTPSSRKQNGLNLSIIRQEILSFTKTIFLATLLLAVLANIDMILVRHYLNSLLAGQYASLTTIGKLIFYTSAPFITVMFPMVASAHTAGRDKEKNILKTTLAIVLVISSFVLLIFIFFPQLVIKTLFGQEYLAISPYLVWFSLATGLNTLSRTFISFFLAINRRSFLSPLTLSVLLQTSLIIIFHQNISQVISSLSITNILLFLACWLIYSSIK